MAVVFDAQCTSDVTGSAATSFSDATQLTIGSGANRALIVMVVWSTTTPPTGVTFTWNGLALTLISKDPSRYGVEFEPEPPLKTDAVTPGQPVDLRLVAETIDTDLETLRALNPQLLRLVTPTDPQFALQLPEGTAQRFFAEMAAIPADKWVSWRRHKVEQGETLSAIAKRYHVLAAEIAQANDLAVGAPLEGGRKLIIPAAAHSEALTGKVIRYRVRRTDTVASIADEFDVSVAELPTVMVDGLTDSVGAAAGSSAKAASICRKPCPLL